MNTDSVTRPGLTDRDLALLFSTRALTALMNGREMAYCAHMSSMSDFYLRRALGAEAQKGGVQ